MSVERKRLESYLDEYETESSEGMGLKLENYEGGGNNMPDESEFYESRLEWLQENDGPHSNNVWMNLAKDEVSGVEPSEGEELVFIKFPQWLLEMDDNEDWQQTFGKVYGYFTGWAILDVENSEGKNAWAFKKFHIDGRWKSPRNKYGKLWGPRSCFTLYRRDGSPNQMDKQRIRRREALPDNIDAFEASEDDYDWRYALGAAYRQLQGEEKNPLVKAKSEAQALPDRMYERVEVGVDEYKRISKKEGNEVSPDELAKVITSLTRAVEPGASLNKSEEE